MKDKNVVFNNYQKQVIYNRFPGWLIDSYRNVKNNKRVQTMFYYFPKESGKAQVKKSINLLVYLNNIFPRLSKYIEKYNNNRHCQNELLNEFYNVIHKSINYKRCIEFIYEHLVNLERRFANRLEIEDILNTTDYKKYIIAYSQINNEFKIINKERGKGNALDNDERKILIHNKELDIINYVGSLIDKKPLTWYELETIRENYKINNYNYKDDEKLITSLKEEINRLRNIITELGGKY